MQGWCEVEAQADADGVIPKEIYSGVSGQFPVCDPPPAEAVRMEADAWGRYLSATRGKRKPRGMYEEMYRYEWYEGRRRGGFWGGIEAGIRSIAPMGAPRIAILSAGSGRDLLKVGLAAGIWRSVAPERIRGTWLEIDPKWFRLVKPEARIVATEFSPENFARLSRMVSRLEEVGLLVPGMVTLRRWSFRERLPLATGSQDLAVFSLTGNYATEEEQPRILGEIARCIAHRGHLVASTMREDFDFIRATTFAYRIKFFMRTPLAWAIVPDFVPWQVWWGTACHDMVKKGFWKNAHAETWGEYVSRSGMVPVTVYPAPCDLVPVEVLVARKVAG